MALCNSGIIYTIAIDLFTPQSSIWEIPINSAVNTQLTSLTRLIPGGPQPWNILSPPYDQSVTILFSGCNVRSTFSKHNLRDSKHKEERKMRWLTDGLYYWTEDWPHICSVVPISGAEFDEEAVGKYSGKQKINLPLWHEGLFTKLCRIVS